MQTPQILKAIEKPQDSAQSYVGGFLAPYN